MKRCLLICVTILAILSVGIAMGAPDDSLVLYLTFDDDAGNSVKDISPHLNNGSVLGNPKKVDGIFGSALEFNGAGDSVEIPDSDSLDMESTVTIEMWVMLAADGSGNQVGLEKGGWETGEYSLYANYDPGNGLAMQFMDLPVNCGDANSGFLGPDLRDGQWHHIAGTWDGDTISLYTDGELSLSWECAGGSLGVNSKSAYIGGRNGIERFLKGVVDEVRLYNRTLSEADINKDMETLGGLSVDPSGKLAVLWSGIRNSY